MTDSKVFTRLDDFEFDEFVQEALPALEAIDAVRLLTLLAKKLSRNAQLASGERYGPGSSSGWCRNLDQSNPVEGVRAQLARVVAGVASRASTTPDKAARVFEILESFSGEIFDRIQLFVLARAGRFVPDRVDAFFQSTASLEPKFRGREIAEVVREQFENASDSARSAFERRLREGPLREPDKGEPTDRVEQKDHWQRRRLLWFRDRLPESLRDLGGILGVTGERLSSRDHALAEDGFFIGGGFTGDRAPISADKLGALPDSDFVEFVSTWKPQITSIDSPTREGLQRALTEYASAQPADAIRRASALVESFAAAELAAPGHVQALLAGLRVLIDSGATPNVAALTELLAVLSARVEPFLTEERLDAPHRPWRWLATEVLDLIIVVARRNLAGQTQIDDLWRVVDNFIKSPSTWLSRSPAPSSFEDILMAALNSTAGRSTEAVIEVALASFRLTLGIPELHATSDQIREATSRVSTVMAPLLRHALKQEGKAALAAQAVIGTYVPQIHFLDRDWLMDAAPALFTDGAVQPLEHPAWAAYVVRAPWYRDVFTDLREWYLRAADNLREPIDVDEQREQWSITQHLGEHVLHAYFQGLIAVSDADGLMAQVFRGIPGLERAHLSWQIFRGWTDAGAAPPEELVRRLIHFWRWRLDELENMPASAAKTAELGGLTWLICTPYLSPGDVLELGLRTVEASRGEAQAHGPIWEALGELSDADVDRSFSIADVVLDAALRRPHPYIPASETEKVLRAALVRGTADTQARATRLIHRLGEHGLLDFGRLLQP